MIFNKSHILLYFLPLIIHANMPQGGFAKFPNSYFVETGTAGGNGINQALNSHKFAYIYSIEINGKSVTAARRKFQNAKNVQIFQGDSGSILYDIIKDINEPITFWLDGHAGTYNPRAENTPLLRELDQIKQHHIKTHTILIDDMHCAGKELFDFITKDMIIAKIKEINPAYEITYIDGGDRSEWPNNIMVAQVP